MFVDHWVDRVFGLREEKKKRRPGPSENISNDRSCGWRRAPAFLLAGSLPWTGMCQMSACACARLPLTGSGAGDGADSSLGPLSLETHDSTRHTEGASRRPPSCHVRHTLHVAFLCFYLTQIRWKDLWQSAFFLGSNLSFGRQAPPPPAVRLKNANIKGMNIECPANQHSLRSKDG